MGPLSRGGAKLHAGGALDEKQRFVHRLLSLSNTFMCAVRSQKDHANGRTERWEASASWAQDPSYTRADVFLNPTKFLSFC